MSVIADLPDTRPSLLLDFANSRRVHPLIQCTRASTATCYGPDGKLRTVANNVPRIEFDPVTGKCLGVLGEESRGNLLTYSEAFTNAAWVKSAGAVVTDNSAIAPDGALTAGTVVTNGGSSATNRLQQFYTYAVASGVVATFSVWLRADVPYTTGLRIANQGDADGANLDVNLTTAWQRFSITRVFTAASASIRVCVGNTANNGTLQAWGAQLELGGFATSYMPTTAAAQTRAADMLSMIVPQLPSDGYTVCIDASINWVGEYPVILSDNSTGLGNYVGIRAAAAGSYINSAEGGRSGIAAPRPAAGVPFKMAAAISNDASKGLIAVDGVLSAVTSARTAADFSLRNILKLGAVTGAAKGVNLIRRVAIYPRALAGAQLQRLTA